MTHELTSYQIRKYTVIRDRLRNQQDRLQEISTEDPEYYSVIMGDDLIEFKHLYMQRKIQNKVKCCTAICEGIQHILTILVTTAAIYLLISHLQTTQRSQSLITSLSTLICIEVSGAMYYFLSKKYQCNKWINLIVSASIVIIIEPIWLVITVTELFDTQLFTPTQLNIWHAVIIYSAIGVSITACTTCCGALAYLCCDPPQMGNTPTMLSDLAKHTSIQTAQELLAAGRCDYCHADYQLTDTLRKLQCGHFFHQECIDLWLKDNSICPTCRQSIVEAKDCHEHKQLEQLD